MFLNDPDIGGRYSALSYFGLVPAALMGVDVEGAARPRAHRGGELPQFDSTRATRACGSASRSASWRCQGRDKLTFVVDEPIASFGLWVEQLIAESTGKHGKGILPVADEPLGDARASTATTACSSTCSATGRRGPGSSRFARPATRCSR